jgi:hypothetical protein
MKVAVDQDRRPPAARQLGLERGIRAVDQRAAAERRSLPVRRVGSSLHDLGHSVGRGRVDGRHRERELREPAFDGSGLHLDPTVEKRHHQRGFAEPTPLGVESKAFRSLDLDPPREVEATPALRALRCRHSEPA